MIAEAAQDLITKLKTITSFGTTVKRVGLAAGAKGMDPMMEKADRPAAWVIFVGDSNPAGDRNPSCVTSIVLKFVVKVIVDYNTESDLLNIQYPLLEEIIQTVAGKEAGDLSVKWKYDGQALDELTGDRMVFDQRYSITVVV